jgi:hypothetical protein
MPIVAASEVNFSSAPRCPVCGVGVLPYGRHEPLVVDGDRRPYCRDHAATVEPGYPAVYATYKEEVRKRRLAAIEGLKNDPPEEPAAPSVR